MKTYHNLDEQSKKIMRDYFQSIGRALEMKSKIPSNPEELEKLYPPIENGAKDVG